MWDLCARMARISLRPANSQTRVSDILALTPVRHVDDVLVRPPAERGWEKIRQAVKSGTTREFADTDVPPREPQPPVFRQPKSKKRIEREKAERKKLAMAVLQEDRNALKSLGAQNRPRRFGKSLRASVV